jgi:hypothetical protein
MRRLADNAGPHAAGQLRHGHYLNRGLRGRGPHPRPDGSAWSPGHRRPPAVAHTLMAAAGRFAAARHKATTTGSPLSDMAPALGVAAALIGLADMVPYVRDTVRRSTRPHRGTWLIWTVLAVVVSLSQQADGASWSVAMAVTQAATNGMVLALAIRFGTGGLSTLDASLIALAGAGVGGWLLAGDPLTATACVVVADLVSAAMMVPKTWRDPGSETLSTFAGASLAGALSAVAVAAPDPSLLLYPAYYCLVNGALALLIVGRRGATSAGQALRRPPAGRWA